MFYVVSTPNHIGFICKRTENTKMNYVLATRNIFLLYFQSAEYISRQAQNVHKKNEKKSNSLLVRPFIFNIVIIVNVCIDVLCRLYNRADYPRYADCRNLHNIQISFGLKPKNYTNTEFHYSPTTVHRFEIKPFIRMEQLKKWEKINSFQFYCLSSQTFLNPILR